MAPPTPEMAAAALPRAPGALLRRARAKTCSAAGVLPVCPTPAAEARSCGWEIWRGLERAQGRGVAAARAAGYAVDDEEKNSGMRCIAAPVFDMNGEVVAGLSVSGPTSRVSVPLTEHLSRPVIEAARELTYAIGGLART